jgi:hypothetical protein
VRTFYLEEAVHQGLVLRPSYVPEKVGINKKRKRKIYYHKKKKELHEINYLKSVKPKMAGRKLRSGILARCVKAKRRNTRP